MNKPRSAARIGGLRGDVGNGWGYERTNPDYVEQHEKKVVADYFKLDPEWRQTFLDGLPERDKALVKAAIREREVARRSAVRPVAKAHPAFAKRKLNPKFYGP